MTVKIFDVEGIGPVKLQKRRGTKHLKVALSAQGEIKVSLPAWVPYKLGLEFTRSKKDWILEHRSLPISLADGQSIGKAHRLQFIHGKSEKVSSRLNDNLVRVTYPVNNSVTDQVVQKAAQRGAIKALQKEADALLPDRLSSLATKNGYKYQSVQIKHLRSKWGSCNHKAEITLNLFLMTLPWELIDYVLLHELVHTKVLRHGKPFWSEIGSKEPKVQALRKRLRSYQPTFQ